MAATKKQPRRDGAILILMTTEEREEIAAAAQLAGVATSTWLRMLGLREARKQLKQSPRRNI